MECEKCFLAHKTQSGGKMIIIVVYVWPLRVIIFHSVLFSGRLEFIIACYDSEWPMNDDGIEQHR